MNRSFRYIVVGLGVALLCWCCVVTTGVGLVWSTIQQGLVEIVGSQATAEPGLASEIERRPPAAEERQTGDLLTRAVVPGRDLVDLAHRLRGAPAPSDLTPETNPPGYKLGDEVAFWLHNVETNKFFDTEASLGYVTPHAYWWIEKGYSIPPDDLEESALRFEEHTYPTNRQIFGSESTPGIDGDPHIYIFLGYVPGVGGSFSPPDEYPAKVIPHSNEHEMFYINLDNAMPGNAYFDGILAHEFQHMIHWNQDRDEETWINEAMSELASQLNGYDVGGSDIAYARKPDTQLTAWAELDASGPHYGASYLFGAYVFDQYGAQAISQLVAEPENGIAGVDAMLAVVDGSGRQFTDLYADWLIANYLDDPELADGRYGYGNVSVPNLRVAARHSRYPVDRQATVGQYAADYVRLEGQGDLTVEFTGSTVVSLVGNRAHSGRYQWWSNRRDESDARLTREFDLTGLQQATLQAWMWYDLEVDYDYAYVEVSADGGQTWTILANDHTITTNPSGNSYGPALTGKSGDNDGPAWVQESFDLTRYAGQRVLIRFEVVTDEELNHPGLCLDDVTIPELGYAHDAESGAEGWLAEGFLQVTDQVPQQFLVQLITIGDETRVERMVLDDLSYGTMTITGLGQSVDRAVLVISALAPVTTEQASYRYQITQK
ncbi:MAG: immune inhibitor A [Anaerolineae bacterium]|nr:immune inhibitor A [Anaerolineae bacterium]